MIHSSRRRWLGATLAATLAFSLPLQARAADAPKELKLDWAYWNPVSLVIKDQKLIEKEFEKDGVNVRWVQSAGSNKALEFLNAGSLDIGSSAGSAALLGKIHGNPIKSVYVYSRPEWTALVTRPNTGIRSVADLKGKSVAVTRGTDPHIFLIRALADHGLTEKDVKFVLLQHADGRAALSRGDVDAWAGLDPILASAELEENAVLFFRKPDYNTWGVLNVREDFAARHPDTVKRVIKVYEQGRQWALANPDKLVALLATQAKIPEAVARKQLTERTELTHNAIGRPQYDTILAAGEALKQAGVVDAKVDVARTLDALIDPSFSSGLAGT